MKIKIQKMKFIRNILIGVIAFFIVSFIINTAPGYKRNKYQNVTNLVIGSENVTENLIKPVYINEEKSVYISKEDISQFFDSTIYYEEASNSIISASPVTVANMKIGVKAITINNSNFNTLAEIIYRDNTLYIPIQEFENVYNIDVKYIKEKNIVIIDKLNEGMIKAEVEEETDIKYKPRSLSKDVGTLGVGNRVSAYYTTSKGWRLIRTEDGIVGYVKANVLTNEYIVRQDLEQKPQTKVISINTSNNTQVKIDEKDIIIKDLLVLSDEGILIKNVEIENNNSNLGLWANLTMGSVNLQTYDNRLKLIKNIVSIVLKNDIKGINVILTNENENISRFIIELAPRLNEMGIKTNLVTQSQNSEKYLGIVDYIITK